MESNIETQADKNSARWGPSDRPVRQSRRPLGCLLRFGLLFVVLVGCLAAAGTLFFQRLGGDVSEAGGRLAQPRELYLRAYLAANSAALTEPAGSGFTPAPFTVMPGETADAITENLAQAGLLNNSELFINYIRYHNLDQQLEAGDFIIDPQQTIPELADTLTKARVQVVELRFVEGWRVEQMADYLAGNQFASIDAAQFLAIARRETAFDLSPYPFLTGLAAENTLEGFLFPDTYRLPPDADAAFLVDLMLQTFDRRLSPAMRQGYLAQGLSIPQAVTLASIVEREAVVSAERPIIAGVFYNRLAQGIKLEADPTVQYPLGYQPQSGSWWKSPLSAADLALDSPYNTYRYAGLPPGPIANPSLSSLEAVAFPAETPFIFFVADCTASVQGSHIFSETYEAHLANVQRCR